VAATLVTATTPRRGMVIVRSEVHPDKMDGFEDWYRQDHLPQVVAELGAQRARRFRSVDDGRVHVAVYEFDDIDACCDRLAAGALGRLVDEYDRVWARHATRLRDVLVEVEDTSQPS
jgi:LPS sulfotransferase NodH